MDDFSMAWGGIIIIRWDYDQKISGIVSGIFMLYLSCIQRSVKNND